MKFRYLIVAAMLLAGCASQQPQPAGRVLSDTPKSQINKNRDRDLYECEREAAFAGPTHGCNGTCPGGPGEKRQVFDRCMKARGY
jgi:outer membrane biogenesis lipoprotein LolB